MDVYTLDFTTSVQISGFIISLIEQQFTINSIVQTALGGNQVRTQMVLIDNLS